MTELFDLSHSGTDYRGCVPRSIYIRNKVGAGQSLRLGHFCRIGTY